MTYGDECTRGRDIDDLESKTRDLDMDLSQAKRDIGDLQSLVAKLEKRISYLQERIAVEADILGDALNSGNGSYLP